MITLTEAGETSVQVDTIVHEAFQRHLESLIRETLKQSGVKNIKVHCQDQGALDYTIKARLEAALARYEENDDG